LFILLIVIFTIFRKNYKTINFQLVNLIVMRKIYILFLSFSAFTAVNAQIEGTWKLADQANALMVGPNLGDGSWWSNSAGDVATRACLFDDSITFAAGGAMTHYMDGNTWLEAWQGVPAESCGAPVAPHDGTTNAPYTYTFDATAGLLTVNGIGAHIGLAKVINGAEINNPANAAASITYQVSFANNNNTMIADINFGPGWWRFVYERTNAISLPDPNVTFKVDMSDYTGAAYTGVFLNGTFNNWCGNCTPMMDEGNGIWSVTVPMGVGPVEYKFTLDGWNGFEEFAGTESCIDPVNDGFANRYVEITGDTILPLVCYNSCEACPSTNGIDENTLNNVSISPNPANDVVNVSSTNVISEINIIDLSGKLVKTINCNTNSTVISIGELNAGAYNLIISTEKGIVTNKLIVE
jgi:hypothetical protein